MPPYQALYSFSAFFVFKIMRRRRTTPTATKSSLREQTSCRTQRPECATLPTREEKEPFKTRQTHLEEAQVPPQRRKYLTMQQPKLSRSSARLDITLASKPNRETTINLTSAARQTWRGNQPWPRENTKQKVEGRGKRQTDKKESHAVCFLRKVRGEHDN